MPNFQRRVNGLLQDIFRAFSHGDRVFAGGIMSGRLSIPICAAAALLALGIGTDLQATTRPIDCLAAPNASSPRGQHWYYHIDLPNNRKCWYLHVPVVHGAAKAPEFHAVSTAADTPESGSRVDSALRLHTRKLSSKPQQTSFVSTKSIRQGDERAAQQSQGNTPQVNGSKPTDAVAASSPATAKLAEQSDAPSVTKQSQGSTLSTDAVVPPLPTAAATPAEQSDAPSVTQQSQGHILSTDAVVPFSPTTAAKPAEQSDAPSVTQQPEGRTLSKPTDAVVPSSPTATLRVNGADSAPPDADAGESDDDRRITERSKPTADIVRGLSFTPVQMFLLLVLGVAIIVFLISLAIILHQGVTTLIDFQLDRDSHEAQAQHGLQDDGARRAQMFVDDQLNQVGIDALPGRIRPSATRTQNRAVISTELPPKSSLEEVEVALKDFRAELSTWSGMRFRMGPRRAAPAEEISELERTGGGS
jgi:hypothetical protein